MTRNRRPRNRHNSQSNNQKSKGNNRGNNRGKRKKRFTNKISEHFSKKDFVCRSGMGEKSFKISLGLVGGLELLRSKAGKRINILKGFQSQESAEAEGSFKRNFHAMGIAAKITIDETDAKDAFLLAESVPEFMGIGLDLDDNSITVDTRKAEERVLWVIEKGTQVDLTNENRSKYFKVVKHSPDKTEKKDTPPKNSDDTETETAVINEPTSVDTNASSNEEAAAQEAPADSN